ncbi:MazG nucleotide pyrophosphohydrolase domain-containing protein [Streptomyces sp. NPDC018352]|uniref:MazG nucleotide pyrophosphohydrolase domain-containing protein n=1 Tax=Streptomyces sp. NPDC018352 TaxID=3157194 RepID=UPI0033DF1903
MSRPPQPPGARHPRPGTVHGVLGLALLAAEYADVCVVGVLTTGTDATSCVLDVAAKSGDLPAGARPVILRGTAAYGADGPGGRADWLPLRRIRAVTQDGTAQDLAELDEETRTAIIRRAGLDALEELAAVRSEPNRLDAEERRRVRTAQEESLVPLAKACGDLARTLAELPGEDLPALRRVQEQCRDLYGRLESDRALAWALEELGELAQAMRRGESTVRVEEELGQVLVWALCLANITRTDAAHAFAKAFTTERDRQLRKHGTIRPYRRQGAPC